MKITKRIFSAIAALTLCLVSFASCGADETANDTINVISREDGSGARGAFIELFGIEEKDADGNKVDKTYSGAEITSSTAVMLSTVEGNKAAIGYVSLGSLGNTVKAVKIDGAEATVANIKDGSYKISRPFNIVTGDNLSDAAQDFINFIMSDEGQAIVEDGGYISVGSNGSYEAADIKEKITVSGSSSVSPIMEKLKETYLVLNPKATIELQTNDSTTGVNSANDGTCDIGMASRDLKDSESEKGVTATSIAIDGIAVIVNKENDVDELTSEQVKSIFTAETISWSEITK